MNRTMQSRTALLAVRGGLAVALLAGCAPTGSPRTQAPAPEDEVSVGYGTQSKRRVTGAVTSISPTEADARVVRLVDVLQARVPGLEVLRLPDGTYSLRIRGGRSIGRNPADDEPLLVIDDVPVPRGSLSATLAGLAVRDVARIDVLKDAASTSIYGFRGAGGVIIITTKRGP
jgi:TonB-dependent starch-binding outer membrane protein SusC